MVVVTVKSLDGQDVADFARNLGNRWGVGRKAVNDGVILVVAPNERKARIAVGDGLRSSLSDSVCQDIMDRKIIKRFKKGDLPGGIQAGIDALIDRLSQRG